MRHLAALAQLPAASGFPSMACKAEGAAIDIASWNGDSLIRMEPRRSRWMNSASSIERDESWERGSRVVWIHLLHARSIPNK